MKLDKKLIALNRLNLHYQLHKDLFANRLSFMIDDEMVIYTYLISKCADMEIEKDISTNQYYITIIPKTLKFMGNMNETK